MTDNKILNIALIVFILAITYHIGWVKGMKYGSKEGVEVTIDYLLYCKDSEFTITRKEK